MNMLPWTAQIKYQRPVHWHAAGLTPMTGMTDPPLDVTVTPDSHTVITRIDPGSVALDLAAVTTDIGVAVTKTTTEVTLHHSTDLLAIVSHVTGAPAPITTATTHLTADLHLTGIHPEMTADLDINPASNTTDQHVDPRQLHEHQIRNIRIRNTSKLLSTTHHQSTTAEMIMTVIQRTI